MVLAVLREWNFHHSRLGNGYGLSLPVLERLARGAARALADSVGCDARHPQRSSIVCGLPSGHVNEHRNEDHQVEWSDDGRTIHVDLGEMVLVEEPDGKQEDEAPEVGDHWRTQGEPCLVCSKQWGPISLLVEGPSKGLLRCPKCDGIFMDRECLPGGASVDPSPSGPDLAQSIAGPAEEMLETLRVAQEALDRVNAAYPGRLTASLVNWVRPAAARCADSAASLRAAVQAVAARG